jgi:hypothetical protein
MLCKGGGGAAGGMWETVGSVKMVFVCVSFQNGSLKVMVSKKCYVNFEYISIMKSSQQHKEKECNLNGNGC